VVLPTRGVSRVVVAEICRRNIIAVGGVDEQVAEISIRVTVNREIQPVNGERRDVLLALAL